MAFLQDGVQYDLESLDLYEIKYKIKKNRIKVRHSNGRYYDINNRVGKNIVSRATDDEPLLVLYQEPTFSLGEYKKFIKSNTDSFKIPGANSISEDDLKQILLQTNDSKDKFVAVIKYRIVSTGQEVKKALTISKNNEIKTFESLTVEDGYDNIIDDAYEIIEITIKRLKKPTRELKEGAFFPYHNQHKPNLIRYQIFSDSKQADYTVNCLIYAFKMYGIPEGKLQELKLFVKTQAIPRSKLKDVAKLLKININLRIRRKNDSNWKLFNINVNSTDTIKLCLYENHYFICEKTEYTSYSINNYHELNEEKRWNRFFKKGKRTNDDNRFIQSWKLIDLMLKNNLFTPMTLEQIADTQFHHQHIQKTPKALSSGSMLPVEYEKKYTTLTKSWYKEGKKWTQFWRKTMAKDFTKKKTETKERTYVFADFETDTSNGDHKAFMISYTTQTGNEKTPKKTIFGADCAVKFLKDIPDYSVIYFHNLGYDINFIFKHTESKAFIKNGSFVYLYTCKFENKNFEFRDSYAMIPSKLSSFPKMFGMQNIKKEIMPYSLYKVDSYAESVPLENCKMHIQTQDWKEFVELAEPYTINGMFDRKAYAQFYCERDVELLQQGLSVFRRNAISEFDLDPFAYLTVSSLANAYQLKEGCFDGVLKLGGCYREFIQASVKGGRCMTRCNERFEVKETLNDFDGVSLYPSAMAQMDGYLKGEPKTIVNFEPENYSHYYVKINITAVNKHLDFPLISLKDENGILQYKNECCTMYVDKYALEDLVEFQQIEYEFLEGYYFDEGFNTQIKTTIKHMFNQRLKYKKDKNPIQIIYKLLMNSSYGKTIMKEHLTDDIIIHKDKYNDYVYRHHNYIKQIVQQGDQYWISKLKPVNDHCSFPHVGSAILSYSKRIMNRVFGVSHDNKIPIYYQDTDSMHMKDDDVKMLELKYNEKYQNDAAVPKLVGKGLGQFHCDFDLDGSNDPVSIKSIFLGKKTYIDVLQDRKDSKIGGQHCRFKGIPGECIQVVANELYTGDKYELYKDMLYNKKKIKFDLCKGVGRIRPVFENRNGAVKSLRKFEREVQFN